MLQSVYVCATGACYRAAPRKTADMIFGQADIRKLCRCWNVQLTAKNDHGKYSPRAGDVLKRELTHTLIEEAKKRLRANDLGMRHSSLPHLRSCGSFGSASEASSGCSDVTEKSLADVVSKLSSDRDESAAVTV